MLARSHYMADLGGLGGLMADLGGLAAKSHAESLRGCLCEAL